MIAAFIGMMLLGLSVANPFSGFASHSLISSRSDGSLLAYVDEPDNGIHPALVGALGVSLHRPQAVRPTWLPPRFLRRAQSPIFLGPIRHSPSRIGRNLR